MNEAQRMHDSKGSSSFGSTGATLKIWNPATGQVAKEIPADTPASLRQKMEAARKAQPAWAARKPAERTKILKKFGELLVKRADAVAKDQSLETGKPISQARGEARSTLGRVSFFCENWEKTLKAVKLPPAGNTEEEIRYEPLGVVANISAWNYPWFVGANVFVPALLTGNAVLYKPSEFSALTGLNIGALLWEAGVPKDVFQVVIGAGDIGAELLKQPVDGVFFTGSYATGKRIAEAVAGRMIKLQLELGGKDPTYVADDVADVKAAAEGLADGAFYNNGQSCCSVERIYVHKKVYEPFVKHFIEVVKGFKMGAPSDESTYLGPLTRQPQIQVIEDQLRDAASMGAKVETGGKRVQGAGWYFEPTVLTNVTNSMKVMRDESFGPVIGIQAVGSDDEAVSLMNDTEYGLTAGVYTKNRKRAEGIMAKLNAGSTYWNCCDRVSPQLPWTGRKQSGMGSTLSTIGILAFVQPKGYHLRAPAKASAPKKARKAKAAKKPARKKKR
ncbi:MAG: aldehyde dehydrogenase family protein [Bdellovibrionales bacterium]|nr:aldehyde dehydrogenase family protein [Bdellovibrionales bacterium]